jgi:hypothetical protein
MPVIAILGFADYFAGSRIVSKSSRLMRFWCDYSLAPRSRSNSTISLRPSRSAKSTGVRHVSFFAFTFAPFRHFHPL